MKKIAIVLSIPTPYRTPLIERLSKVSELDLRVFYCSRTKGDRYWNVILKNYYSEFLPLMVFKVPFFKENVRFNPYIWKKLSEGKFDCVLVGGYFPPTMLIAILWALIHNVPYIINSESQLLNKRSRWKSFIKSVLLTPVIKKASAYLPTGKYQGEYLEHYGANPEKMFYFPNTPDIDFYIKESDRYKKKKVEIKKELGIKNKFVLLFVGRLVKVKGLYILLKGFKEVKKKFKDVSLLLIGDGILKYLLKDFVEKEEIEDVHFIGSVPNIELPKFYAISDIFVLPSLYEPWGVVVNEAMASGLPVILSDKVGSRGDLLKEGENGFTYPSEDYEKLAGSILKVLCNPKKVKKMGQLSREIIINFDYAYCEENLRKAFLTIFKND